MLAVSYGVAKNQSKTFPFQEAYYFGIKLLHQVLKSGPVIIIEDDLDDQSVISMVIEDLGYPNKLLFFPDGDSVLEFLNGQPVHPFLILSDIQMPKIGGIDLKQQIQQHPSLKRLYIPYIFLSTSGSHRQVSLATGKCSEGFFLKPPAYQQLKETIRMIFEYWQSSFSPESSLSGWDSGSLQNKLN